MRRMCECGRALRSGDRRFRRRSRRGFANIEKAASYYDVELSETNWQELGVHRNPTAKDSASVARASQTAGFHDVRVVGADDDLADEALLVAGAGDAAAFGLFYPRRVDAVLAFFLRRTGDRELAADLTAETFAAALSALPRYDPQRSSALAWLFSIAHHKMADSIRRGQVEDRARRRLRLEPLVFSDEDIERVEQRAATAEGSGALLELERLSAEQRGAIEGRVLQETEYDELARRLRCSESVVRKRVSRGLAELRTRMKEA